MTPDPDFTHYASTGSQDAFRRLVRKHIAHVHSAAHRRLGACAHLAADVTQAVFVKLAKVARALPADICPGMWLHRQAVSTSIDTIRSETRRRAREQTAATMHQDSSSSPPHSQQTFLHLDEALERLTATDRAAVVMRFFEQREFEEVGAALRTTPEAARKRITRALEKLRTRLSRRGVVVSLVALESLLHSEIVHAAPAGLTEKVVAAGAAANKSIVASFAASVGSHKAFVGIGTAAAWIASAITYWQAETHGKSSAAVSSGSVPAAAEDQARGSPVPAANEEKEPRTIPEIVAAIKALYEGPPSLRKSLTIDLLLRKVQPSDYRAFFQLAEKEIGTGDRIVLWDRTLQVWIKSPEALTRAMFAADSPKADSLVSRFLVMPSIVRAADENGGLYYPRIDDAFKAWLKADAHSAARWLLENHEAPLLARRIFPTKGTGSLLDFLLAGFFAEPAAMNSPEGKALAKSLSESGAAKPGYDQYVSQLFYRDGDPGKRTSLESLRNIANQFVEAGNPAALRMLGYRWRRRPEEFAAQVEDPGLPGRYWIVMGTVAVAEDRPQWAEKAFALRGESGNPESALFDVVDSWLAYDSARLSALVEFIRQNAAADEISPALERVVQRLSSNYPAYEDTMRIAAEIPDTSRRDLLLRGVYRQWLEANPERAAGFPARSRWPAETLAVISDLQKP